MQGTMMDFPLTLRHLFERNRLLFGRSEVVTRLPDKSIHRYPAADFTRRAMRLAAALQKAGLKKGDRVGTMMWNSYAHLEAYFGVPLAGGVFHTLNFRLHPSDLEYIINYAEDRFIIVDDMLLPLLEPVRAKIRTERIIVAALSGQPVPPGFESYEDFIADAPAEPMPVALEENDAAGMCYTSGTTGRPKGVVYSHRAIVLHTLTASLADALAVSNSDTMLIVVPMFHVNSWGIPFCGVMTGARLVLPGAHLDPISLLDLLEREKVTFAAGVPTIWLGLLHALEKEPGRWKLQPGLRTFVGGSAAPESLIRGLDKHGVKVVHAWGMTEMSPLGSIARVKTELANQPEDALYALRAKQGMPSVLVEMRVVNEKGIAPWDGATMGELHVRGPFIASHYYKDTSQSDKWTKDGWFITGDVATIDPDGYMKLTDRTKDLIKSGGEWISSVDLENALMGHPAVREAAVIAVPHPKWDERPLAVVVLKDGAEAGPDKLKDFLAAKFAKWWLPDGYAFVPEIPKNPAGKFMKSKLRDQFENWTWGA
ncbi:MAG: fatty-acid--CoA ligase [Alphaproteobacteria bacterium]|nr:fatty-acid--CoA ligase [Alphaproteobacteria bacterium]